MFINMDSNASYNFKAPNDSADADKKVEVSFPSVGTLAPEAAAAIEIAVKHFSTHVVLVLDCNAELSAVIDSLVTKNAEVLIIASAEDADRTLSFGSGFTGLDVVIPTGKTVNCLCKYDGTTFRVVTSTNDNVQDGSIVAAKLAANAVETAKINDSAVTAAKLAADAVETAKIKDAAVTPAKVAKGENDTKTYVLKSVNGVVGWVEDV